MLSHKFRKVKSEKKPLKCLLSVNSSANFVSARKAHGSSSGDLRVNENVDFKTWKEGPNSLIWVYQTIHGRRLAALQRICRIFLAVVGLLNRILIPI
jgi:hypothetical protein